MSTSTRKSIGALFLSIALVVFTLPFLPVTAHAQSRKAFAKVTPGSTTPLSVVPSTPVGVDAAARTSVTVQNVGSVNVAFGGSSSITYATGFQLAPAQQLICTGDTDALYAVAASSTADLRIMATYTTGPRPASALPSCSISRLSTSGIANTAANTTVPMSDGSNVVPGNVLIYLLTTAITPNSTTTSTAAGTLAMTSNATGIGTIFRSDGTNWQLLNKYSDDDVSANLGTIATTSATSDYVIAPSAGTLTAVDFSGVDALTANNTNYITFSITNLGQSGSGTNPLLAATAPNTTQATGGSSIAANTKFALTINGTGSNLIVAKGDRLKVTATVTGTLANTVTFSKLKLYFTRLS